MALVGDTVRYADGSETRTATGSGAKSLHFGRSIALIGSELENGDRINGPIHDGLVLVEYADAPIPGLFQAGYFTPTH